MSQGVNSQTGTSYTVRRSDRGKLIVFSNGAPVAVTVPQAIGNFGEGFSFSAINRGAGTVTFTPASGTINGAGTLALVAGNSANLTSDGTNWDAGMSGTGATGPTGPAGPTGLTGPAGADGKTILYGAAAPTTEGVDGDFYIRTTTNFIYGPKSGGVWPAGTSLIGPTGAPGAAGTGYFVCETKRNCTAVANLTTEDSLVASWDPLPSGVLNTLNRRMKLEVNGFFTSVGGETPTLTFSIKHATVSVASFAIDALTAGVTGVFNLVFDFVTNAVGAGATGTLMRSAKLHIQLAGSSVVTTYVYCPSTASSNVTLDGTNAPLVRVAAAGTQLTLMQAIEANITVS